MKLRTLNEAAEILGLSRHKLLKGIQRGAYPAIRWGNRLMVDVEELAEILAAERERHTGRIGLKACAEAIGLTEDQLRRMALAGLIPYERSGRYYRFDLAAVEKAIRENMKT